MKKVKFVFGAIIAVLGMAFFFWFAALAMGYMGTRYTKTLNEFDSAIEAFEEEKTDQ